MTKKKIHTVYGIILSVALVIAGVCLIAACLGIYNSGDRPYNPESVAAAFAGIAWPVYICLALIAGGFLLDGFWSGDNKKNAPEKQYAAILEKLHAKASVQTPWVLAEQKKRRSFKAISLALLGLGSIVFLAFGIRAANFTMENITGSMVTAMGWLLPCMAVPFGFSIFTAYYCRKSIRREIDLVKQAIAEDAVPAPTAPTPKKAFPVSALRWALLAVALGIFVFGFFAGGTNDVLTKAVNICTECVGLG